MDMHLCRAWRHTTKKGDDVGVKEITRKKVAHRLIRSGSNFDFLEVEY
jgi:hypothetical protein